MGEAERRELVIGNWYYQLSTINRSRAGTLALQLSIDRERGRSHYNYQLSIDRERGRSHYNYQLSIDRERGRSHYNYQLSTDC